MTLKVEVKLNVACVPVTAPFWREGKQDSCQHLTELWGSRAVGKQRESRPRRLSLEAGAPRHTQGHSRAGTGPWGSKFQAQSPGSVLPLNVL